MSEESGPAVPDVPEHEPATGPAAGRRAGSLPAGAVARRLGIAVTTLRSWDRRYGLGPRDHAPGRHRRYTPEDVARLERVCDLIGEGLLPAEAARAALDEETPPRAEAWAPAEPAAPSVPPRGSGGHTIPLGRTGRGRRTGQGLARAAMRLDADAVTAQLDQAMAQHGVVDTWQELVVPVLTGVGRKWETVTAGDFPWDVVGPDGPGALSDVAAGRYVEVEHLLSGCVAGALHRAPRPRRPARGRGVLLACTEAEMHSLALEALAAALAERGVVVRMLGACVPVRALLQAVRRTGPAAVVLWSQRGATAAPATLTALRGMRGLTVYPAGPGWTGHVPPGDPRRPASLAQAVTLLAGR